MRIKTVVGRAGLILLGVALALMFAEGVVRWISPQPIEYFTFLESPAPGSVIHQWGKEVRFNSFGMRDVEHDLGLSRDRKRIMVIGDSITYGTGVAFGDVYHQVLRGALGKELGEEAPELFIFNQGARETTWAREVYKRFAEQVRPHLVVLGFCLNDLLPYDRPRPSATIGTSLYSAFAAIHTALRVRSHLYFLVFERSRRWLYANVLDRKIRTRESWLPLQTDSADFETSLSATVEQLVNFRDEISSNGGELLVVIFPFEMQLSSQLAALYQAEYNFPAFPGATSGSTQAKLISHLKSEQIEYLDLLPDFAAALQGDNRSSLFFRELGGMLDWIHPNEAGHRIAGEVIAKRLIAKFRESSAANQ